MRNKVKIFERKEFIDDFDISQNIHESRGNHIIDFGIKSDEINNMYNGELRIDSLNKIGVVKVNNTLYKINLDKISLEEL